MLKIRGSLNTSTRGKIRNQEVDSSVWPTKPRGGISDHVTPGRTGGKDSVLCLPQNPIGGSPPIVIFCVKQKAVKLGYK